MMPGLLGDLAIEQMLRPEIDRGEKLTLCYDYFKILPGSNDLVDRCVTGGTDA
jgi:hypothetical protein